MVLQDPRGTQTIVKHEILSEYLQTWGGIIAHGLKRQYGKMVADGTESRFRVQLVYVDCFAFTGRYEAVDGKIVYGSPIIGIQEFDKLRAFVSENYGFEIITKIILAEKDLQTYQTLLETLNQCGYQNRVHTSPKIAQLPNNHIAVFHGDYHKYLDEILQLMNSNYTWTLCLLDPYGVDGIDFESVRKIVSQAKTDTIIYYPHLFIERMSGLDTMLSADGNPDHPNYQHISLINKMYGDRSWLNLAVTERAAGPWGTVMPKLVDLYQKTLQSIDDELAVKNVPLLFEDRDRVKYYLFLTTHDGTGALKMNEILDKAKIREFAYRIEKRITKSEQKSMFSTDFLVETRSDKPQVLEADIPSLAEQLIKKFSGETIQYKHVLRRMANSPYYESDIKGAVRYLRKNKRVSCDSDIVHKTEITFSKL